MENLSLRFGSKCMDWKALTHWMCMQLRDYLHRSLYDPTEGYFTASTSTIPVGSIGKPLEFNKLLGQADYLSAVKQHYNHLQVSVSATHSCLTSRNAAQI